MRALALSCLIATALAAEDPPAPKPFFVVTPEARGGEVVLVGKLQDCLCVSAEITAELTGMRATPPVPIQRDITEAKVALTTLRPADKGKKSNYTYGARFYVGRSGSRPDYGHVYRLPYPVVARFRLSQGYGGNFSHDPGSPMEFSVDWAMPVGTAVLAARDGTVVALRADQTVGGPTEEFHDRVNLVVVEHADGTLAEYLHLRKGGVAVKLGQKVAAGDLLGHSGFTGYAREPQLQVRIYRIVGPGRDECIPVRWETRDRYEAPRKPGEPPFRIDLLRFLREQPAQP